MMELKNFAENEGSSPYNSSNGNVSNNKNNKK